MRGGLAKTAMATALVLALGACGGGEPDLLTVTSDGDGPDEFSVLPNRPLQRPENLAALPPPTPGGGNRGDLTPRSDAVVALGGTPGAGAAAGPLVTYAARYGLTPQIRSTLAGEDLAFRRDNDARLLERLFGTNIYYRAYATQSLDQYAALEAMRRAGVRTPAAPPDPR